MNFWERKKTKKYENGKKKGRPFLKMNFSSSNYHLEMEQDENRIKKGFIVLKIFLKISKRRN